MHNSGDRYVRAFSKIGFTFKGETGDEVESHLLRFKDFCDGLDLGEEGSIDEEARKLVLFRYTLGGPARQWYAEEKASFITLDDLEKAFRQKYSQFGQTKTEYENAWRTLKYDGIESLDTYARRVKDLGKLLNLPEETIVHTFIRTMPYHIWTVIFNKQTMREVLHAAKEATGMYKDQLASQQIPPITSGLTGTIGTAPVLNTIENSVMQVVSTVLKDQTQIKEQMANMVKAFERLIDQDNMDESAYDTSPTLLSRIDAIGTYTKPPYRPTVRNNYAKVPMGRGRTFPTYGNKMTTYNNRENGVPLRTATDNDRCFYCQQPGHFKRDCPILRERLKEYEMKWTNKGKKPEEEAGTIKTQVNTITEIIYDQLQPEEGYEVGLDLTELNRILA